MKELYLTDTEALVLEQILETVREVYNCLGHSEWSGDGDENRVTDAEADKAVEDILSRLDHQPSSYDDDRPLPTMLDPRNPAHVER